MTLGRFTANACDFYDKLGDLVTIQQRFSGKNFGPARERDARGPLDHLKRECDELAAIVADPNHNTKDMMSEVADLFILLLDVWWRLGVKAAQVVDAATEKMKENEAREWPPYAHWVWNPVCENSSVPENFRYTVWAKSQTGNRGVIGQGNTPEAATEDAYRQIRDLSAHAVEHVREPQKKGICPACLGRGYWYSPDNGQLVTCSCGQKESGNVNR